MIYYALFKVDHPGTCHLRKAKSKDDFDKVIQKEVGHYQFLPKDGFTAFVKEDGMMTSQACWHSVGFKALKLPEYDYTTPFFGKWILQLPKQKDDATALEGMKKLLIEMNQGHDPEDVIETCFFDELGSDEETEKENETDMGKKRAPKRKSVDEPGPSSRPKKAN